MTKRKNATRTIDAVEMSDDEVHLWTALEHVGSATLYLRAARAAFGEDECERPDLAFVRKVVAAAKECLRKGIGSLGSLEPNGVADNATTQVLSSLYDTFDVVVLVATALKAARLPKGDGVTICPVAGSLSTILTLMPLHETAINGLARSMQTSPLEQSKLAA